MAKSAREIARLALHAFRKSGTWADAYLKDVLGKERLSRRDAALASQLTYGVLQNDKLLDFYIASFSSMPLAKIEPQILDILRIGVYQIVFLDRIPPHAAVNESVALARRTSARAAGFVNALLRRILAVGDALPEPSGTPAYVLSTRFSHPEWLVSRLLSIYGDETERILEENNKNPAICARVNPLVADTPAVIAALEKDGVTASMHPWLPLCVTLTETGDITQLSAYREGMFHICDPASQLAALALGVQPGMRVLDTCAAPGGKSFILAEEMQNTGALLSCDIHAHKLRRMCGEALRLHITNLTTEQYDARLLRAQEIGQYDAVLCDVPCSGLGVIRKKPEIRFKKEAEIARLPEIQCDILRTAAQYVAPGGVLVYSTCTILPCENEEVIQEFLKEYPAFSREAITLPCPNGENAGEITLLPHRNETDGFYICKLRRTL